MNFTIFISLLFLSPAILFGQDQFNVENKKWISALKNEDKGELSSIYFDKAALFLDYQLIQEKNNIAEELKRNLSQITSFHSKGIIPLDSNHIFQMGYYLENEITKYAFVTAWTKKNGAFLKEFETIFSNTITSDKQNPNLDKAREKWITLANTNQPEKLLKGSYTKDAYYFHRETLSQGHKEISERYNYMSRPGYRITLTADEIIWVQPNLAMEVGEYKTNGSGKYVLIWQKQKNKEWKALLDFNF
ncbi:hypothetical protein [Flexithrix dorotheae]|uniref:hypothetical protein n=1 Tax=Flexithrix dorotheae TaxID=70993 RepID=UPI0003772FE8|nr:hypothetical protein [Flexithrix dorotheae]